MTASTRSLVMRYPRIVPSALRGGAVAIGNFDGIHKGHAQVLTALRHISGKGPAIVLTFYPHPLRVLKPDSQLRYISSVREKAERCGALGIDLVYFMRFNASVASMSALEFIEKVLVQSLAARHIVVGEDVGVGRGRQGDLEFLRKHLPAYGIEVHSVPKLMIGGVKAGSRKIREVIQCGEVDTAAELMGAPFTISARVGHGDKRGSAIGFPTANIAIANRLIPKSGVYACLVTVAGITHKAVANIGTRPTFSGRGERLEVHLLDFNPRSLYGVRIHVAFRSRLRSEQKFSSVDELTRQIALDIQRAREVLNDG